jgi:hypothetical protein
MNPIYLKKDDEFKSLSINNMRYFYGSMHEVQIDKDLKIYGNDQANVMKIKELVCNSIL